MGKLKNRNARGFTILELMVGMAVFLIISGAVLISMSRMQTNYRTAEINTQMQQQLRETMELMAQEIGQAGLQASTVEGGATGGDATFVAPYKLTNGNTATGLQTVALTTATGVFAPYVGQWLQVDGGANQEAVQITEIPPTVAAGSIQANFGILHAAYTPAYPMGIFPHGILSDQSNPSATGGGKLAMFGEINGSGNGLWAVEYACPATFPGPLTRTVWNLSTNPPAAASKYNLIDNVTACYFCWPGVTSAQNANCPTGLATPDTVTLPSDACASDTCTYSMITQVGFTITALETVIVSGSSQSSTSTQNITVTKSYSNVQPRNVITADKIYQAAVTSATNANNGTTYLTYLNGELQPDPASLANVPW
jgi:prepilin-type N-terminal cleavage/methylation domain-containing protein